MGGLLCADFLIEEVIEGPGITDGLQVCFSSGYFSLSLSDELIYPFSGNMKIPKNIANRFLLQPLNYDSLNIQVC